MLKTKMLNKTVTTTLILLLTLSILSVINMNINMIEIPTVYGTNITTGTATLFYVNETHWSNSTAIYASNRAINDAIGNSTGNCTISVYPGTYNYSNTDFPITINVVNLTIQSTGGAASTTIIANGSAVSTCAFNITASNATIGGSGVGFTIKGGIPLSGDGKITVYSPAMAHVIDVYADYATIEDNTIVGYMGNTAGIHISYTNGTGHLIQGNTFRHRTASEGWGIFAENLTSSVIQNNLWYGDNQTWSTIEGAPGTGMCIGEANNVNITGNTAYNVKYAWLTFIAQYPMLDSLNYMYENCRNATITNIRVTNNTVHDSGRAVGFEPGKKDDAPTLTRANLTIGSTVNIGPGNKFYNDGDEIVIRENRTTVACVFGAENIKVNNNDLYNSAVIWWGIGGFGVWCGQTGPVNATFNWWGDPLGPRNATGSVVGDYVSDNVTYTPWLTVPHELDETAPLNIYPTSGPPGLYVGLSSQAGTFTGATTNVTFYFAGVAVNSTMAESTGAMNGTFKVPERSPGIYTVRALGNDTLSGSTSFTITTPTITVSPTRGSAATPVTITGTNWNCSGTVNVDISNTTYSTDLVTGKPNGTGVFTNTTTIPSLAIGTYTINATDGINTATTSFIIPDRSITLNVTSGPPSLPVLATGEGYTIGGLVDIYFDTTLVTSTTGIAASGNISASFNVPGKTVGPYTVKTHDVTANKNATTSFTIPSPSIALNVTSGPPGTPVRVTGPNFNVSGTVTVKFNTTSVLTLASNTPNGTGYLNATFKVPYLTSGLYTVNASDGINYATTSFTISAPSIALNVTSGPAATPVMVYGPNFNCSGTVNVYFNASLVQTATANGTGYLNTTFTVPSIAIGTYVVNASDGINYATTNFTVGAAIYLSPSSGVPGDTVTVTGAGLSANQTVTIYFDSTLVRTVNATAAGALPASTNFTVPDAIAGAHNVRALDVYTSTYTPNATFTVNSPSITLTPASGQVGQSIDVSGTNFKLNATVNIYFGSTLVRTVNATAAGALPASTNFTVPSVLPGVYTVNASDGVNYATATFNVYGTGGIDTLQTMVAEIEAKLDMYGSFYNFTNTWFTTISNKLGNFTGTDTVATLLYEIKTSVSAMNLTDIAIIKSYVIDIEAKLDNTTYGLAAIKNAVDAINFTALETKVDAIKLKTDAMNWTDIAAIKGVVDAIKLKTDTINWADITSILTKVTNIEDKILLAPSELKFDFGTATSLWEHDYIQITNSTAYSADLGYGWTNTTGLDARDRDAPDYTRRDFVFSPLNRTFQVDLTNGNYTVIVTMGDQLYAHDLMQIYAEGTFKANVTTTAGTFAQKVFTVSVTDGTLDLAFADAGGIDPNWVINSLIIQRNWK
jgi:hypothetical protein